MEGMEAVAETEGTPEEETAVRVCGRRLCTERQTDRQTNRQTDGRHRDSAATRDRE